MNEILDGQLVRIVCSEGTAPTTKVMIGDREMLVSKVTWTVDCERGIASVHIEADLAAIDAFGELATYNGVEVGLVKR